MGKLRGFHRVVVLIVALVLPAVLLAACGGSNGQAVEPGSLGGASTAPAASSGAAMASGAAESGAATASGAASRGAATASGAAESGAATTATGEAAATGADLTAGVSDKFKGTTLNMIAANHAWTAAIQPLLPEFEKASGMKINLSSFGEDQLSNQLTVKFTARAGDMDVFMFRPLQEGKLFAVNGWLGELTSNVQGAGDWKWDDFQQPARGTVTFDGKVYGVPIVTEREILYYRKDIFEQKGIEVPKTLDELMAAAQKLNDPQNGMYGFVARGQRAPAVTQFSSFLYSMGGDWVKDGQSAVGSQEAIKAYQFYGDLLNKYGAPGVLNMSWPQAIGIFGQGKAAMYTDADSLYPNLLDKSKSVVADKVGFAVFPAGPAGSKPYNVTSWALGMSEQSQNKDAAFEFIKWATSQAVVAKLQSGGLPGARTSVWQSDAGKEGFPPQLAEVIQKSADIGVDHDRPLVVRVGQARDIVGGPIVAAIQGQDVAAAAKDADTAFQQFLKEDATAKK